MVGFAHATFERVAVRSPAAWLGTTTHCLQEVARILVQASGRCYSRQSSGQYAVTATQKGQHVTSHGNFPEECHARNI